MITQRFPSAEPPSVDIKESDLCNVIHTSGTTGRPKGAAFTNETQIVTAIQYCLEMGLDRGHVGMSLAPVVIGAATNFFVAYLFVGAAQVMIGDYEASKALRLIAQTQGHRVLRGADANVPVGRSKAAIERSRYVFAASHAQWRLAAPQDAAASCPRRASVARCSTPMEPPRAARPLPIVTPVWSRRTNGRASESPATSRKCGSSRPAKASRPHPTR